MFSRFNGVGGLLLPQRDRREPHIWQFAVGRDGSPRLHLSPCVRISRDSQQRCSISVVKERSPGILLQQHFKLRVCLVILACEKQLRDLTAPIHQFALFRLNIFRQLPDMQERKP